MIRPSLTPTCGVSDTTWKGSSAITTAEERLLSMEEAAQYLDEVRTLWAAATRTEAACTRSDLVPRGAYRTRQTGHREGGSTCTVPGFTALYRCGSRTGGRDIDVGTNSRGTKCSRESVRPHGQAVLAHPPRTALLGVVRGDPLLKIDSVSYLADGRPLKYYEAWHRGDRSKLEIEVISSGAMSTRSISMANRSGRTEGATQAVAHISAQSDSMDRTVV